jgi:hypothetical protein
LTSMILPPAVEIARRSAISGETFPTFQPEKASDIVVNVCAIALASPPKMRTAPCHAERVLADTSTLRVVRPSSAGMRGCGELQNTLAASERPASAAPAS